MTLPLAINKLLDTIAVDIENDTAVFLNEVKEAAIDVMKQSIDELPSVPPNEHAQK